jgi:P-type conjugative transfer protein TrbL
MVDASSIGIIDQGLLEFQNALRNDFSQVNHMAFILAFWLTVIQVTVIGFYVGLRDGLVDGVIKAVQSVFIIGIFIGFIYYGGDWIPKIINGFINIGAQSSGVPSISPSSILDQGLSICNGMLKNFSGLSVITHPLIAIVAAICMIAILVLYALIAANAAIALVKAYCLVTVSGLMFAFGTNEITRPIAMNYIKAVLGIGLYLLVFYLLLGVGVTLGQNWSDLIHQAIQNSSLSAVFVILGAVIIFYMVITNVPQFIAGLSGIGGFQSFGGAAVGAAITAGTTGAGALGAAAKVAGKSVQGAAQAGAAAATAAKSMAGAVKDTVMKNEQGSTMGQKVNQRIQQEVAKKAAQKSRYSPPKK